MNIQRLVPTRLKSIPVPPLGEWRKRLPSGWLILGVVVWSALCLFIGFISPLLGVRFVFMLGAVVLGIWMLFIPAEWVLFLAVTLIFSILGPVRYFSGIDAQWAGYILGLGMFVRALMEASHLAGRERRIVFGWGPGNFLLGFILVAGFSTLVNPPNAYGLLVGFRGLAMLWGFYFLIALGRVPADAFRRIAMIFLGIGFLQLPLSIYQRLFVASERTTLTDAPWDAVVGSFDGYRQLGGDSGGMGIFVVALLGAVLVFWRRGMLSKPQMLGLLAAYCVPILVAEVKVVFVLIPAMGILVFAKYFRKNLPVALLILAIMAAGLVGLSRLYHEMNTTGPVVKPYSAERDVEGIFGFSLGTNVYNRGGEMGRFTSLIFWWEQHDPLVEPLAFFVGDGMGASGSSKFHESGDYGQIVQQFNFANSSATFILWEYGILGLVAYAGMMVALVFQLRNLSREDCIPPFHQALLESGAIYIVLLIMTLPYNKGLFGQSQPSLLILVTLMGYAVFWKRQLAMLENKVIRR